MYDPVVLSKLRKAKDRPSGFMSCPAVIDWELRTFAIRSPYSFTLRAAKGRSGEWEIRPVFPATEIQPQAVQRLITVQPRRTWRQHNAAILQLALPYVFVADQVTILSQIEACTETRLRCWSLIAGRFNIYDWQRPINWACEWDMASGDLSINRGQVLCGISFETAEPTSRIELVNVPMNDKIRRAIAATTGVTSVVRGTSGLFQTQRSRREGNFLP